MMKKSLWLSAVLASASILAACASTATPSDRRVVKVAPAASVTASNVNYASREADAACDTRAMRKRVLDDNPLNDIASITVQRELSPGRRTETDLDVNCRDYFARQLGQNSSAAPRVIRTTSEPTVILSQTPMTPAGTVVVAQPPVVTLRTQPARRTIRVRRGDTLYGLARQHCTGWKTLAKENDLANASRIAPGDVLYLPTGSC